MSVDAAGARRQRDRAPGHRQDARDEARWRSTRRATSRRRASCASSSRRGLIAMMHLPGFGPKRARRLYDELGHRLARGAARGVPSARSCAGCAASARRWRRSCSRRSPPAPTARPRRACCSPARCRSPSRSSTRCARARARDRVEVAGSLRRQADAVKDLDVIATADDTAALVARARGAARSSSPCSVGRRPARARRPRRASRSTSRSSRPTSSATCCSTSPAPRPTTSRCARRRCGAGCTSRSTASSTTPTGETLRCATEEDVYARLGLPWIPPELREGRGELEAAAAGHAARARHARGPARRPALPHDALRRPPGRRGDGRGRARARLRVPGDHRPLGQPRLRQPRRRPTRCARRSSACARSTRALDGLRRC